MAVPAAKASSLSGLARKYMRKGGDRSINKVRSKLRKTAVEARKLKSRCGRRGKMRGRSRLTKVGGRVEVRRKEG